MDNQTNQSTNQTPNEPTQQTPAAPVQEAQPVQTPPPTTPESAPQQPAAVTGPTTATSTETPPSAPTQPVNTTPVSQTAPTTTPPAGGHNKKLLMLTGVFLFVILLAGSTVYVMGVMNRTKQMGAYAHRPTAVVPTRVPTPTVQNPMDVNAIDTGDPTADLSDLEKDVSQLQ